MYLKLFNIFFDFTKNLNWVLLLSFSSCVILYLCIKAYKMFFDLDKTNKIYLTDIKTKYISKIESIDIFDKDFSFKLNREIRLFLWDIELFKNALAKSKNQVSSYFNELRIKNVFEELEKSEYSESELKTSTDRKQIKEKIIQLINKI